ncbi:uncharacterized protein LOC123310348 [Coccinella septempunctata]|uniref:uncharacterized protein LOC123310348 n=1 Tax=Coccinella septempunctata TaxID=41139 RepID=UPI001D0644BE|nr:uncharacterized protein LOC123310348 [Coccinella septempunctata]
MPSDMAASLAIHTANRTTASNRISEILDVAKGAQRDPSLISELIMRIDRLEPIYKQFESCHSKIVNIRAVEGEEVLEAQEAIRSVVDRNYFTIKAIHYNLVEKVNLNNKDTIPPTVSHVRLPKISLPTFGGILKEWPNYRDLFVSLVDKNSSLSNIEKFQYLLSSTSNDALEIVKGITLSGENYPIAFNSLLKRYNNKRLLAVSYWNEIFRFPKLEKENFIVLRKLLSVFSENLAALDNLDFPVDEWDFPLFNILLEKIDPKTRTKFELDHSKIELPKYTELVDFLTNHCKALEAVEFSNDKSLVQKGPSVSSHKGGRNSSRVSFVANTNSMDKNQCVFSEILVTDSYGNKQKIRALLDNASQASFITTKCLNKLGLRYSPLATSIHGIGSSPPVLPKGCVTCTIGSCYDANCEIQVDAFVLPRICSDMPNFKFRSVNWPHISCLKLADPKFHYSRSIDMLLSADIFARILVPGKVENNIEEPIAINTLFGWILTGRIRSENSSVLDSVHLSSFLVSNSADNESLENTLKRFWELERIPEHNVISEEDRVCERIFTETTTRDVDGRYIVDLPFISQFKPSFNDSREIALRRFFSLENRLYKSDDLRRQYGEFMHDYLNSGHMSLASDSIDCSECYYLPHHCVFKLDSSTTKLRVVFDASQKCSSGFSLNDLLYAGPKLQNDLVNLLVRFRTNPIAFVADIKQMFRQILVSPKYRNYQRIFWRDSKDESVKEYTLNTVTFGVTCSPFLANRTIKQLAVDEGCNFPLVVSILKDDIYIDDILSGSDSLENSRIIVEQLINIFNKAGFPLRKWASNCSALLDFLPDESKLTPLDFDDDSIVKVLGLRWNPAKDTFCYSVNILSRKCTKRSILSELARIFDPLGFLAPLTFFSKYLTQTLWTLGLDWDDVPPPVIVSRWDQYKSELHCLETFEIPRFLGIIRRESCELHGFCDASEKGFAGVVYLRVKISDSEFESTLVLAKTKVAPLKKVSIPRLELCAAVLLSNILDYIQSIFSSIFTITRTFAWSDSKVALCWIKSPPTRWKTFVGNRVASIQEKISPNCWHHISGSENPADIASRGCLPSELINNSLWWAGPSFLKGVFSVPEVIAGDFSSDEFFGEQKLHSFNIQFEDNIVLSLLDKHSFLSKIQSIVAYLYRFSHNAMKNRTKINGFLTIKELNMALNVIIRNVQGTVFAEEINRLKLNLPLSKTLRKLTPFICNSGLLRVGGRLINAKFSYDRKFPILLPRQHRLTKLLIESFHRKYMHPGPRTLQHLISQQYWILSPRRAIRGVISKCVQCFRANPRTFQPLMGNLPSFRISQVKPFSCIGIDFGGPFYIKSSRLKGAKIQKAYLCLFVCCATKALHLELASDLSTDCFLAAFRRFIGRRGRVSYVHTDGGTNFVGAANYIKNIMKDVAAAEKIEWAFNPPATPHFGGLSEGGIKSVKTHLFRVIGEQILTFEEFNTLLVQIEAVLNSRPLTELSPDPNDLSVLTPGHFLTMEPLSSLPDPDLAPLNIKRLDRWQLLTRLHQDFWRRWHNEYLHTLNQRLKWTDNTVGINVGDLVLLKDEKLPPLKWKTGRITELYPGKDGVIRVASVKTTDGHYKRGLTKLCPLPRSD